MLGEKDYPKNAAKRWEDMAVLGLQSDSMILKVISYLSNSMILWFRHSSSHQNTFLILAAFPQSG